MTQSRLGEALDLWREITGVDPNATSGTVASWQLRATFDALQQAIDLDPTEVTAHLLLGYFLNSYLVEREVSLLTLLEDPHGVAARLVKPRALMQLLAAPELLAARDEFVDALTQALDSYGAADRPDVQEVLRTPDSIALLRRDALRSVQTLRVDQFLDGVPEPSGVRPVYTKSVHQWYNLPSAIAAAVRTPSGVSLNLIRHPDGFQSFFCFLVRNGGNLFVVSDVPEYAHPLQATMSRRPDRSLDQRIARNWFPYDLLGVAYDEETGRLYLKETAERGLVAYQNAALPLQPIADLPARELVWVSMVLDLLVERFWNQQYKAPHLSYTAEMLHAGDALIERARTANLPVPVYEAIGLPALRRADITSDAVTDEEVGRRCHEPNRWLEDRYGPQVPDTALNLLAAPERAFALDHKTGEVSATGPGYHSLTDWQQARELAGRVEMVKLDATSFGSRERIAADRKFVARANFAIQVNLLAHEEFARRKDEIQGWYAAKVKANAPTLLTWCGLEALWVDEGIMETFSHFERGAGVTVGKELPEDRKRLHARRTTKRQFLHRTTMADSSADERYGASGVVLGTFKASKMLCHVTGSVASSWVGLYPANPAELALVAGCPVTDLPDVLQHWTLRHDNAGNQILNRIDPMIWKARNPWLKLRMTVCIPLSKRAMVQIARQPVVVPAVPGLIAG